MSSKIPTKLVQKARHPDVKLALILEFQGDPGGCRNCGGPGLVFMFLATNGPFDTPGGGKFVSKYHNGKWWCAESGSNDFGTQADTCPECRGVVHRNYVTVRPALPMQELAEDLS